MPNLSTLAPLGPTDKAGVLLRVSTRAQAADNKTSITSQQVRCRTEMERFGVPVVRVFEEAGFSGGLYHARPELQDALDALERGDFNVFVVAFFDRSSREREYQSIIRRRVQKAGGRFYPCDMGEIDENDPTSALMADIHGDFSAYEKKIIRRRTMDGKREAALAGKQPTRTYSPFGYHIVQKNDVIRGTFEGLACPSGSEGKYLVVEEEAVFVRQMFADYAGGASLREVARRLWNAGARPKKGGAEWPPRTVLAMLDNPVYKGEAAFGMTVSRADDERVLKGLSLRFTKAAPEGSHTVIAVPALVDAATWEMCQIRRNENRSLLAGAPDRRQLLSGFAFCANCGRKLLYAAPDTGRAATYRCSEKGVGKSETPIGGNCGGKQRTRYNRERSEQLFVQGIAALATGREVLAAAIDWFTQTLTKQDERDAAHERARVWEKRVADLKQKEARIVRLRIEDALKNVDTEAYTAPLVAVQAELKVAQGNLETARAAAEAPPVVIDAQAVASFVARAMASIEAVLTSDAIPRHEKNRALLGIVDRVRLEQDEPPPGKRYGQHPGAATIWLKPLFGNGTENGELCITSRSSRRATATSRARRQLRPRHTAWR